MVEASDTATAVENSNQLPVVIVTGASGFIGSYLVNFLKDKHQVYAIARRSQNAARIQPHPNLHWMRVDIGIENEVKYALDYISIRGGAEFLFHMAGFFDFDNRQVPEYDHTNVQGTLNVLKHSRGLNLKRFIFGSSLTVSRFDKPGTVLNEESPADATFPYAVSKARGEEFMREYSSEFPTLTVRFAAIFSDWCQYTPLHTFLSKWLSSDWDRRILVGKGLSAIPYLHINDLLHFFNSVMLRSDELPSYSLLIASTEGCISHHDLFTFSMHYNHFNRVKPVFVPKWLARIGVVQRDLWGRLKRQRPFERFWMVDYVDTRMVIDPTRTFEMLKYTPNPRYHILRRLPFLIANMKRIPHEWHYINQHFPYDPIREKKNLALYRSMWKLKESVVDEAVRLLMQPENRERFKTYHALKPSILRQRVNLIYSFLEKDILVGDHSIVLDYAHLLALDRRQEGFEADEVCGAIQTTAEVVVRQLLAQSELKYTEQQIQDEVMLTLQMAIDEIIDTFENQENSDLPHFTETGDTLVVKSDLWFISKPVDIADQSG